MAIDLRDFEAGTPFAGDYSDRLDELQETVSRLFVSGHVHRRRALILFEGWDAGGKGGAIQRLVAGCDPRAFKVWPIGPPNAEEKARHYLWRFWTRVPAAGRIAIFDRSWYGRVLVERVEALATEAEWRRAYDEINEFESQLAADGTTIIKFLLHISDETQKKRFLARLDHPWKSWKLTAEDVRNRAKRGDYLAAMHEMLERTDMRWAPWTVIDANDKKAARIAVLERVAQVLERAFPSDPPPPRPEMEQLAAELRAGRE